MNNSEVAKNGFKTFIVTLVTSLFLFSVLYYVLNGAAADVDIEQTDLKVENQSAVAADATSAVEVSDDVAGVTTSRSVFGELSQEEIDTPVGTVLAGASESTSAVPSTGSTEITYGFLLSLVALGLGAYLIFLGPRKAAIKQFERDVMRDLD
jgi:hypothetical protein